MKTALDIVKNIFLAKLEEDPQFSEQKVYSMLWEKLTVDLLHFEEDAKPIYAIIYSLELADAEKVISKLPVLYSNFLKELAETYVLGEPSEATDYLLKTKNKNFNKEVGFLTTMQQAINRVERKRIKTDLPNSYDRLVFELSETDLENVIKKKSREDLRDKFKQWDMELVEESAELATANHSEPKLSYNSDRYAFPRSKSKVISLSWTKYAVAASLIIAAGIFYFKNTGPGIVPVGNTVVTTKENKEVTDPQIDRPVDEIIALAEIETSSRTVNVLEPTSLGFTSTDRKTKLTVSFKDATERILSLEKFLEKNKGSNTVDPKTIDHYKLELANLNRREGKYAFDGKTLTLFSKYDQKQYTILSTEDKEYFLKKGTTFYDFKISKNPLSLIKVTNVNTLEALEKIEFENE